MKIILVMVSTADGKTTKWEESAVYGWSSKEDKKHFQHLKAQHRLIVMGRKTYEHVKNEITLSPNCRRIVMTQRPVDFSGEAVEGQLAFTDEPPLTLVKRLSTEGFDTMLLVGGSELNGGFLEHKLINECYITIEPRFFGSGKSIFADTKIDVSLQLIELRRLNERGSLVVHYSVKYDH